MFNSTVLDIVIGLLFIYLLYSLLVTIISELIATFLGLRARNLKEAIDRMLNDEKPTNWWQRIWDTLKLTKSPDNEIVNAFYDHPEIKYLGSSGVFKSPSNFKANSFAKTVIALLAGDGPIKKEIMEERINNTDNRIVFSVKNKKEQTNKKKLTSVTPEFLESLWNESKGYIDKFSELIKDRIDPPYPMQLGSDTASYLRSLWQESQGDLEKFKLLLEDWFERTMENTMEWYKRKIKVITFVLGFLLAWFFNADTFVIVHNLSTDKAAREQMVSMANAYVQNNQNLIYASNNDSTREANDYEKRLDSLLFVKQQLQADISKAKTILGIGGFPPDSVSVHIGKNSNSEKVKIFAPPIDEKSLSRTDKKISNGTIRLNFGQKIAYFFRLFYYHFWGFLTTAIAISLGAPFWFDLLNKIMQLRTSKKEEIVTPNFKSTDQTVSPLNRVG